MPLLAVAAATMDMERIIAQDGSPGSGGSGQSQQELIVSSLARRKKSGNHPPPIPGVIDRPLPMQPGGMVQGRAAAAAAHLAHPQPIYGGVANHGYSQHDAR